MVSLRVTRGSGERKRTDQTVKSCSRRTDKRRLEAWSEQEVATSVPGERRNSRLELWVDKKNFLGGASKAESPGNSLSKSGSKKDSLPLCTYVGLEKVLMKHTFCLDSVWSRSKFTFRFCVGAIII